MMYLKQGVFYYVGYDEDADEYIYSSGTHSAQKFNTLEELDKVVDEHHLKGYAVVVED